jgi:hypothetical protein
MYIMLQWENVTFYMYIKYRYIFDLKNHNDMCRNSYIIYN